jgi:hypothetical protein
MDVPKVSDDWRSAASSDDGVESDDDLPTQSKRPRSVGLHTWGRYIAIMGLHGISVWAVVLFCVKPNLPVFVL